MKASDIKFVIGMVIVVTGAILLSIAAGVPVPPDGLMLVTPPKYQIGVMTK